MSTKPEPKTKRQKKLDTIMRSIAMFAMQQTYTDEGEAQRLLAAAIESLEKAQALLVGE